MLKALVSRTFVGLMVASGLIASVPTAEARVGSARYDPAYGAPFPGLNFFGTVQVDDGGCTEDVNFGPGGCNGSMSFVSATLNFGPVPSPGDPAVATQTINFTSAQFGRVLSIDRLNLDSWSGINSTAFTAVQGTIPLTYYDNPTDLVAGGNAWFSLIFRGEYAQVIWFRDNPGEPLFTDSGLPIDQRSVEYLGCLGLGAGDNRLLPVGPEINRCGLSSFENNNGAPLLDENGFRGITVVPEPEAYAMGLAGLGVIGFMTLLSRRRAAKS